MTNRTYWDPEDNPGWTLGIRRHGDRCFHEAEEEVESGYIVQGILISREDVAESRIVPQRARETLRCVRDTD